MGILLHAPDQHKIEENLSMLQHFQSHKVLNLMVSDYQPTITIFKNLQPIKRCFTIKRLSWDMFREDICKRQPAHYLENKDDTEKEASNLTKDPIFSLDYATKSKSFTTKAPKPTEILKILLDLLNLNEN
ncbi:hypothetical protein BpHYR1_043846 [Brachionus plicatilis]|uniref:Uncharacterized protein n=1 Tax=Brachionus plicatilis TaxID=10195 RepID=A0A3M7PU79_BRAPC|nr:hypothetical protein BpHYR1_043846 [Brachionus plicatilis]